MLSRDHNILWLPESNGYPTEFIYGRAVSADQILKGEVPAPESTSKFIETLAAYSRQAEEAAAREPELAPTPPPAPAHGIIEITSTPSYAEVEINNSFNGLTPRKKSVKAGEYQVTVRKRGFRPWIRVVTVEPGETATVRAELSSDQPVPAETQPPTRTIAPDRSRNSQIKVYAVR